MNKKILLSAFIVLFVLAASLGATMAWFTAESRPIENVFTAGTVIIEAGEVITAGEEKMDNWNPGDCATKEFTIENKGSKAISLRGIIETQWYEWDGEGDPVPYKEDPTDWIPWTPIHSGEPYDTAIEISFVPDLLTQQQLGDGVLGWFERENEPGVYYYNGSIRGNFDQFDPDTPLDNASVQLILDVCLDGPKADNQYQGKVFTLTAKFQAIQASHADEWNWSDFDSYN